MNSVQRYFLSILLLLVLLALTLFLGYQARISAVPQADDSTALATTPRENDDTPLESPVATPELTVLELLLKKEWPVEEFYDAGVPAKISSREDFVNASLSARSARAKMLELAHPAPIDEDGRYVILNNNRFFSLPLAENGTSDNVAPDIDTTDIGTADSSTTVFLHYPKATSDQLAPTVLLTPYFASSAAARPQVSHGASQSLSQRVQTVAVDDALLIDINQLSIGSMLEASRAWMVHVESNNELEVGPKRYFILFE